MYLRAVLILLLLAFAWLGDGKGRAKGARHRTGAGRRDPATRASHSPRAFRLLEDRRGHQVAALPDGHYNRTAKVLIIGAGIAGVAAAEYLERMGVTDFVVLEGSDRVGGRIRSTEWQGHVIEEGAQYVQGHNDSYLNPIAQLAAKVGLNTSQVDGEDYIVRDMSGADITEAYNARWEDFDAAHRQALKLAHEKLEGDEKDISMRSGLSYYGWRVEKPIDLVVEYFDMDFEYSTLSLEGASLKNMPLWTYDLYGEYDLFMWDTRGAAEIVRQVQREANLNSTRLLLNKMVTKLQYGSNKVVATCADNTTYAGEYAILTVSVGVIENNAIEFAPPLPRWKMEEFHEYEMVHYVKVHALFDQVFWDNTTHILLNTASRGKWPMALNLARLTGQTSFSNMLSFHITGEEGNRLARFASDEEIAKEIGEVLRRVYPGATNTMPSAVYVPRFETNPLFHGAYSNWPIGMTALDFSLMKDPIGRLYFAGEALSEKHDGYIQGGYDSGREVAGYVKMCIEKNGENCPHWTDSLPVKGCTYKKASNYVSTATVDDGSCLFPSLSQATTLSLSMIGLLLPTLLALPLAL